jgi:5-deoxy-glucuronate isomerase
LKYFYPAEDFKGYREIVKIGEPSEYTGLGILKLGAKETYAGETKNEEVVLVIMSGKCDIKVNGLSYPNQGERKDVFSGKATAVYVPVNSKYEVTESQGFNLEVGVCFAKAEKKFEPFVVKPEEVIFNHRGILNYQRDVYDIVVDNGEGRVQRIVVGETYSYPGQWSSYPSHKHDTYNPPYEANMEEIYYFKVKPDDGFGIQVIYTDDLSLRVAYMIKDGDTIFIPKGYHPVAAAPGFQVYYLWVMAGNYGRKLIPRDDPKLAWLGNIGPMLK